MIYKIFRYTCIYSKHCSCFQVKNGVTIFVHLTMNLPPSEPPLRTLSLSYVHSLIPKIGQLVLYWNSDSRHLYRVQNDSER